MTFSIVARDPLTGSFGVACATGGPVVGSLVPHARAGIGALATQGMTNGLYGSDGLEALAEQGAHAEAVLHRLVDADPGQDQRQCILVDREGRAAAWTGRLCEGYAGAIVEGHFAVAGNMVRGAAVLERMAAVFSDADGDLADRLLAALLAAEEAGGDVRGIRSAALKVYTTEPYPFVDLRADWSPAPLDDLSTILGEVRAPAYADFFSRLPRRMDPGRS